MKEKLELIGNLIKYERKKQEMKQNVLAKGICSPSYLCKIENNQVEPSSEILDLLLERLNLERNVTKKNSSNNDELRKELLEHYKKTTQLRNILATEKSYKYLIDNQNQYLIGSTFYDFNLLIIYLSLVLKKPITEIDKYLSPLIEYENSLDNLQLYLLKKCIGIYHYNIQNFEESSVAFDQALHIFPQNHFNEYEKADINYMNSLVKIANNQYISCIEEIKHSIKFFLENLSFTRVIECLLIEGIAYQKLQNPKKALQIYKKALELSLNSGNENFCSIIYQNIGSVNSSIGNLNEALENYLNALSLREKKEERLLTIFSIIQIHSRNKDQSALKEWLEEGFKQLEETEELKTYYYHFSMYHNLFIQFNKKDLSFFNEAISYFREIRDFRHLYKYCIKIGSLLKENRKYKQAAEYYEKAIYYKNNHLLNWEDL